jgi:hypothetical protein
MSTAAPPPTARKLLIDWANAQDHWVRSIVGEVLVARSDLSDQTVDAVYAAFLAEKHLSDEAPPVVPPLSVGDTAEEAPEELRFSSVSSVGGVNALAAGQTITFNPRLTLLFGENAAGKTGYVRMLKRLASVRAAEPILGNILQPGSAAKPRATIEYVLNDAAFVIDWRDEAGVPPFTRMSVFDARAVSLHVDDDLTYLFTPGDLALFRQVHEAVEGVKARLDRDRNERLPKGNPFMPKFGRDPVVYAKIESLGPSTDVLEIERLGTVTPEEQAGLQALRDKVDALRPQSADSRTQLAASDRDLYSALAEAAGKAVGFDWVGYNAAVARVQKASERSVAASERSFASDSLPGALGPTWNAFIQAGEAYLVEIGQESYPRPDDKCPYCRQDLDEAALRLLRKYREFCNNAPKRELDASRADLRRRGSEFAEVNVPALQPRVARRRESFTDPMAVPTTLATADSFLSEFAGVLAEVGAGRAVDVAVLAPLAAALKLAADGEAKKAGELVATLRERAAEREKVLAEESVKLRTLENRLVLRTLLPEITAHVENAKWSSRSTALIDKRFPGLLRSLTEQSKIASEHLLNQDFERLFLAECEMLRAPKVTLDFSGRKGQAARRKLLSTAHRLSAILSEGEQKVIALADFLAEVSLRRTASPIVFDDPVNSLDYKRLQYVVDRVVALSATRQTIVFTHNIWFAAELLARFEDKKDGCTYYNVLAEDGRVGIVAPGTGPRWDTPKSIGARINELVQSARKETGETRAALVEKGYELLRSWCEAFVEQELLGSVTRRYQPNVMMTRLPEIKADRIPAARATVVPIFEKSCRMMGGHSQPLETLSVRPTLQELEDDWHSVQRARDAYLKK